MTHDPAREKAIARLRLKLPRGTRFFQVSEEAVETGDPAFPALHLASLYNHSFGLSEFATLGYHFILSNSFLASHAYNLALVISFHRDTRDHSALRATLRHNFKKVFAECALQSANCLIGRVLLVETLTFEQELMRPIFARADVDGVFRSHGQLLSAIMSSILTGHELGHVFQKADIQKFWDELGQGEAAPLLEFYKQQHAKVGWSEATEMLCDALGCFGIYRADSSLADEIADPLDRIRLCALAFLLFGELYSLEHAARLTARAAAAEDQAIVLGDDKRVPVQFSYISARLDSMDARVAAIMAHLAAVAQGLGGTLDDCCSAFAVTPELMELVRDSASNFIELTQSDPISLSGTDLHRRGLAQLLAESLHGHPAGTEHLLWRSKKFQKAGASMDP